MTNVRKGTQGFIETTRTEPTQKHLGESAVGGKVSEFSEQSLTLLGVETKIDGRGDEDGLHTIKTFEPSPAFADRARKMFGVDDLGVPVKIIQTHSEYGRSDKSSSAEAVCGDKSRSVHSMQNGNPLEALLRIVEHHNKEKPFATALRLLGRDPDGHNLTNGEVTFHYLDGKPTRGTVKYLDGSTIYLKEPDARGRDQSVRLARLTHIETAEAQTP